MKLSYVSLITRVAASKSQLSSLLFQMSSSSALQWLSLVGIIWLQAVNGTNTDFPAYSSQLKGLLSMSQQQLNNLAFASDAGKLFGWFSGVAAIYLPLWLVLIIGSTLGLIGYGVQYLFVINQIASLSYWHVFFLTVLSGNGICWINTVCYVVAIRNFPFDSQVAVGLTTSYQGLTGKVYSSMVEAVSPSKNLQAFLLLNSVTPLIACLVAAPFVRDIQFGRTGNISVGFNVMFVITIITGAYAVFSSVQFSSFKTSPLSNLIGILVSLLLPLVIPLAYMIMGVVRKRYGARETKVHHLTSENNVVISEGTENYSATSMENSDAERNENHGNENEETLEVHEIVVKEEIGVKMMIRRLDFWLYFFVYLLGASVGLVFLNNVGQIAESRGFSSATSLVSVSSSFGFFGRLMPPFGDYYFSRKTPVISSTGSIVLLLAPMAGSFFLLIISTKLALFISTAIIGVCTGAITSIAVSITTDLFGTKNFSVNHNVVVANIPIGSFAFGFMAALLYRKEGDENGKCWGMECYKHSFVVWGCLCIVGTFLGWVLYLRTRKFYAQRRQ